MKKYIRASIDPSCPDWLRRALTRAGHARKFSNRYNLAADKVKFLDSPADQDSIPIYHLAGDYSSVAYIPGVNDDDDIVLNGRTRRLKSIAKSKLNDLSDDIVWVDVHDEKSELPVKQRYYDPRYNYRYSTHGNYSGQYKRGDKWSNAGAFPSNEIRPRDKSGYKVPSPDEMITEYYRRYSDRITEKVDSIYQEILEAKEYLSSQEFNTPNLSGNSFQNAYRDLGNAIQYYRELLSLLDTDQSVRAVDKDYYTRRTVNFLRKIKSEIGDMYSDLES